MILLFTPLGGSSENVGTALFIACTTATPFLLLFEKIQRRTGVEPLMRICGVFFILKAVLMILAPSIVSIYMIEMLQTVTYGFLYPPLYYLVLQRIAAKDMDKTIYVAAIYKSGGQVYTTSVIAYSLGKYCETIAAHGNAFGEAAAVYGYYAKAYFA